MLAANKWSEVNAYHVSGVEPYVRIKCKEGGS